MMRYAAVVAVFAVFMIFFGPSLMAWGRNLARQQKEAWREQEQEYGDELERPAKDVDARVENGGSAGPDEGKQRESD